LLTLSVDGVKFGISDVGSGPAIALLRGFPLAKAASQKQIDVLERDRHARVPHLVRGGRGAGTEHRRLAACGHPAVERAGEVVQEDGGEDDDRNGGKRDEQFDEHDRDENREHACDGEE
jgi:hypothetical protein